MIDLFNSLKKMQFKKQPYPCWSPNKDKKGKVKFQSSRSGFPLCESEVALLGVSLFHLFIDLFHFDIQINEININPVEVGSPLCER